MTCAYCSNTCGHSVHCPRWVETKHRAYPSTFDYDAGAMRCAGCKRHLVEGAKPNTWKHSA